MLGSFDELALLQILIDLFKIIVEVNRSHSHPPDNNMTLRQPMLDIMQSFKVISKWRHGIFLIATGDDDAEAVAVNPLCFVQPGALRQRDLPLDLGPVTHGVHSGDRGPIRRSDSLLP